MRRTLPLIALTLMLTANKCKEDRPSMQDMMDKKWLFQTVGTETVRMPAGVDQPWIQLTNDGVNGFGGCNRLMGGYALDGPKLSFPGVAATRMYCEAVQKTENAITTALSRTDSYRLEDGTLTLLGAGEVVATLVPDATPAP